MNGAGGGAVERFWFTILESDTTLRFTAPGLPEINK